MGFIKFKKPWLTGQNKFPPALKNFSYDRDFSYAPGKHIQEFVNSTDKPLEIWIELYPDLYILQPKDELTIIYEQDPNFLGLGLHTIIGEDCLQIYLQEFDTAIILINGTPVQPENQERAL